MGIFPEDEDGPTPTRAELIRLVNVWLDLERTIVQEVDSNPQDLRGAFERGRAVGVGMAAQDLLELLGLYSDDDTHDDEAFNY